MQYFAGNTYQKGTRIVTEIVIGVTKCHTTTVPVFGTDGRLFTRRFLLKANILIKGVLRSALLTGMVSLVYAQFPAAQQSKLKVLSADQAMKALHSTTWASATAAANALTQRGTRGDTSLLPTWFYSTVTSQDGRQYSGVIVGGDPTVAGTTTVPVVLIPVIFNITQGSHSRTTGRGTTYSFDPTATDAGCLGSGNTGLSLVQSSPLFQTTTPTVYPINGVNFSTTQYGDAFRSAEFYTIASPDSHVLLNATADSPLVVNIDGGASGSDTGTVYGVPNCGVNSGPVNHGGTLAVVDINLVDEQLQLYIRDHGYTASTLPFFVTYDTVFSIGSSISGPCCVLGYHAANNDPGPTYGIGDFQGDFNQVFTGLGDISIISHEVNEWINDPYGDNLTPPWGNVGQVGGGCQNNFEVGDPLTGQVQPTFSLNGFHYHLQELAFYSWFYGGPSLGAGGLYSSNGSFTGPADLCPPGGTN